MAYSIRLATLDDIPTLCEHRRQMFLDMGHEPSPALETMSVEFVVWVKPRLESGVYFAWLAEDGDRVIAGAGLWLMDWPPHILDPHGARGYILNVYTDKAYRQQGLARLLTQCCLDHCRSRGIRVVTLHASAHGKGLYESMGFLPTNEMRLNFPM
jgi:ribosomal protein S18 acetylase RimI-like enzyme